MYEYHKLCDDLDPYYLCIIVEKYEPHSRTADGFFSLKYHKHIPAHRISLASTISLLRSLVIYFENCEPEKIVGYHLNDRGGGESCQPMNFILFYPEPGVLRRYCGSNTVAWIDKVINRKKFRP